MPSGPGLTDAEMNRYGELQMEFQRGNGYDLENRAQAILTGLGIGTDRFHLPVESFSGGWKMRIALARILLLDPDVLLMDEPTNHLDLESIVWLEQWLASFKGDLVMTSHDREFMTRICSRTVEVATGAITTYAGDYDFYVRERAVRREQLIASQKRQAAMLAKEEEFIARFGARASHAAQVQSRVKTIEKIERIVIPPDPKEMKVRFAPVARSGDIVVRMENLSKAWPLPDGSPPPGVPRAHGRGEEAGQDRRDRHQRRRQVHAPEDHHRAGGGLRRGPARSAPASGPGISASTPATSSSRAARSSRRWRSGSPGPARASSRTSWAPSSSPVTTWRRGSPCSRAGRRAGVMLACILAQPVNFLVLDEPTNHLDIASREVLLEALREFDGTLMIVSHDRWFLRHLSNRVFEIDHGSLRVYEGGYGEYLARTA